MPTLLEFRPDPGGRPETASEHTQMRDQFAAAMTALAPMTNIVSINFPGTTRPAYLRRYAVGPVGVVKWGGLDYRQKATRRSTEGIPDGISLAVRPSGNWRLSQDDFTRSSDSGDIVSVVDVTRPMRVHLDADADMWQMFFSAAQLGLRTSSLRSAAETIDRSPLRTLVAHHIQSLPDESRTVPGQLLHMIGSSTIELVRTMLISALRPDALTGSEMSRATLIFSLKQHIRRNLADPGLDPRSVAAAHRISLRHLYNVWDEPTGISEWIITQRLAAARGDLAGPDTSRSTVGAVARKWGFRDSAHFSRRFRAAYGQTPRQWREYTRSIPLLDQLLQPVS